MKKWIFLYISSPLESRWSFSSPNLFHPLPPCPKHRGKWLPSGVFFTSWRFGRKQTRFKISIYSTGFQKKIWKNKQRIYRKINLAIPLCIYIYINIQQGFHRKRFIKISEVLSSSWSQKRIMRRMLPYMYIYIYPKIPTDVNFTVVAAKTVYGERRFFAIFQVPLFSSSFFTILVTFHVAVWHCGWAWVGQMHRQLNTYISRNLSLTYPHIPPQRAQNKCLKPEANQNFLA